MGRRTSESGGRPATDTTVFYPSILAFSKRVLLQRGTAFTGGDGAGHCLYGRAPSCGRFAPGVQPAVAHCDARGLMRGAGRAHPPGERLSNAARPADDRLHGIAAVCHHHCHTAAHPGSPRAGLHHRLLWLPPHRAGNARQAMASTSAGPSSSRKGCAKARKKRMHARRAARCLRGGRACLASPPRAPPSFFSSFSSRAPPTHAAHLVPPSRSHTSQRATSARRTGSKWS